VDQFPRPVKDLSSGMNKGMIDSAFLQVDDNQRRDGIKSG
jgi:hypothetical protein